MTGSACRSLHPQTHSVTKAMNSKQISSAATPCHPNHQVWLHILCRWGIWLHDKCHCSWFHLQAANGRWSCRQTGHKNVRGAMGESPCTASATWHVAAAQPRKLGMQFPVQLHVTRQTSWQLMPTVQATMGLHSCIRHRNKHLVMCFNLILDSADATACMLPLQIKYKAHTVKHQSR